MIARLRVLISLGFVLALAVPSVAAQAETVTFSATGNEQIFTVPAGVTSVRVVAVGGRGGAGKGFSKNAAGGFGAVVSGDLAVTPGEVLYVEVGGNGETATGLLGGAGGFNGGAAGGAAKETGAWGGGGGGGGASDVRTSPRSSIDSLASRLIVAAGGGGGGGADTGGSGGGAGQTGSPAADTELGAPAGGGGAGTQNGGGGGGSGGAAGGVGSLGTGGAGGTGLSGAPSGGGGGGGGLYGGGGGGASAGFLGNGGGGGGGGSNGFAARVTNAAIALDGSGVPSVTIVYNNPFRPDERIPPPDTGDRELPVLKSLLLSPAVFEAANIGPATISAAVGTNVIYELSEPARTTFTVQRAIRGFKKGRMCVSKRPAGKPRRCVRYVGVKGSFVDDGSFGLNRFRFTGRLRGRALRPGKYRLLARARDGAGNGSALKRKKFRIAP